MIKQIEEILRQNEARLKQEDEDFSAKPHSLYATCPSGMWEIHCGTEGRLTPGELVGIAKRSQFTDLGPLKILHDAYTAIASEYLARQDE